MLISDIRRTAADRYTICFDDGSELRSCLAVITELKLFKGRALDSAAHEELCLRSRRALARDRAIELVSRRPMSAAELLRKVIEKGEDEDAAEYSVQWLSEHGFINDESYAAALARHYSNKGFGAGRVKNELQRRGLDRELWDEALSQMSDTEDKIDKFISSRLRDPDDPKEVRRVSAALYRRGFSWEEIRAALRRYDARTEDLE